MSSLANGKGTLKTSLGKPRSSSGIKYAASIHSSPGGIPDAFASAVKRLEAAMGMSVWLLVQQDGTTDFDEIGPRLSHSFFKARKEIVKSDPIALVIHSSGGIAHCAYRIARILQAERTHFVAVVPRRAKSAATLLALGAREIVMGPHAELGPLDAQLMDHDREQVTSALDEVKALDFLHASSLEAVDQLVLALLVRTGKKLETILPAALNFVAETNKPLLEKIDVVHFTQMSRILKEAEEYAVRLLNRNYNPDQAKKIATTLVESYPTHSFMIDFDEARSIGLKVREAKNDVASALDDLISKIDGTTAIGTLIEVKDQDEI